MSLIDFTDLERFDIDHDLIHCNSLKSFGGIMLKLVIFSFSLLSLSPVLASQRLNHIGCAYGKEQSTWTLMALSGKPNSFDLLKGTSKFLTGAWTSEKPQGLNYAFCTSMVGTDSNDSVIIETYRYQAKEFLPMNGNNGCSVDGSDVFLISKDSHVVQRGNFVELEIDWIPPQVEKLRVREYFPRFDELELTNEMAEQKCLELTP